MISALAPAFAEPVLEAQSVFRAVMQAMSRPGVVQSLNCALLPPAPLSSGAAAVALALFDYETPVWLDCPLAEAEDVSRWLRFHTGAPIMPDPGQAAFGLIADAIHVADFSLFACGTPDYPDRSTTLILQVESVSGGPPLRLSGPGIPGELTLSVRPLPDSFANSMIENRCLFPRGVDVLLVTHDAVVALPRSTRVRREA